MTEQKKLQLKRMLQEARLHLLHRDYALAEPLLELRYVAVSGMDRISTNGKCIYFDPQWLQKLHPYPLRFILSHQLMHIRLEHLDRPDFYQGDRWHLACDIIANSRLRELGWTDDKLPGIGRIYHETFFPRTEGALLSPAEAFHQTPFDPSCEPAARRRKYMVDSDCFWTVADPCGKLGIVVLSPEDKDPDDLVLCEAMGLIQCKDVCKSFGEKVALDHVSVDIPKGKIFGLLGPNGAGKTTLIRLINRITIPNGGEVLFDGRPITQDDVEKIGYLPEERGLYRKMKVGEQAMYFAQLKGMSSREAATELKKWFVRFGIESWWNKKVEELSKGMAQKVQFITTVVHKPSLLILDEPFSGFDPVNAQIIREEILRLKDEGATIILSTHNMESVEELCDNIALINNSHLVITGGVDEIRHKYGNNNVELVYTASQTVASVPGIFSVLSDQDDAGRHTAVLALEPGAGSNAVLSALLEQDITVNSFKELVPRMNDIFIKLVTEEE